MTGRPRIVIATPDRAECEVLADWLAADGYEPVRTVNLRAAADEMQARRFDLLVADHVFAFRGGLHAVSRGRTRNPQTPTLVLGNADETARAAAERHNATYIERPIDRAALMCMVSMVIMEHRPVRRSIRKAVPRVQAFVEGVKSRILDVSNEGLRLEVLRHGRPALPPYFNVRVPMVGVALTIQRVWTSIPAEPSRGDVDICGGALTENPQRAGEIWRAFVDALPASSGTVHVQ